MKNSYPYSNERHGRGGHGHGQVNGGGGKMMMFGGEEGSTSMSTSAAAGKQAVGGSHAAGSSGSENGSAVKSFRGSLGKKLFRSSS